jgi:hypothetical protein
LTITNTAKFAGAALLCWFLVLAIAPWLPAQQYITGAGATASGSLTAADTTAGTSACNTVAASCVVLQLGPNVGSVAWSVSGTFVGTIVEDASVDGITYQVVALAPQLTVAQTPVLSATAPGLWFTNTSGYQYVRIRCSAFTSGTVTVFGRSAQAVAPLL